MYLIQNSDRVRSLLKMYAAVMCGVETTVRGQKTRNVRNLAIQLSMNDGPVVTSFYHRGFNLKYAKREWLWYLGADPYDSSIEQHATMWKKLQQPDGSYYSNYGQYLFGDDGDNPFVISQFDFVVQTLKNDQSSRQACMVLLQPHHLFSGNTDVVCTYAINFTIEADCLHMTVMMRSNDVIFGFTNDAFCFSQLYEFVYMRLVDEAYPFLKRGSYTHMANSMHVYERHFDMIRNIVDEGINGFETIHVPEVTAAEARDLVNSKGVTSYGAYSTWLKA